MLPPRFAGDLAGEAAVIVEMGCDGHGKGLFGGVSHKQFCILRLQCSALARVRGIDPGGVRLKPHPIALKPSLPSASVSRMKARCMCRYRARVAQGRAGWGLRTS